MVKAEKNVDPREFAKNSSPILFVEGVGQDRFDVRVMKSLFEGILDVEPLGPSEGVRFAAEAFRQSYPYYFLLIDRDTLPDDAVEKSWAQFDSPEGKNLLILRKREIENYFLNPEFLSVSRYFSGIFNSLQNKILRLAQERLYLDASNYVVIKLREKLKNSGISLFSIDRIKNERHALDAIRGLKDWTNHLEKCRENTSVDNMENRFRERLEFLLGKNNTELTWDEGEWINQMEGKEILNGLLNSSLFEVKTLRGKILGKEKFNAIIDGLIQSQDVATFPPDFLEIKRKIHDKINAD